MMRSISMICSGRNRIPQAATHLPRILPGRELTVLLLVSLPLLLQGGIAAPRAKDLGIPVRAMSIRDSILLRDPVTSRPVLYTGTYTSTGSARVIKFDYAENEVNYFTVPGVKGAYGLCQGADGRIFVGTVDDGRIFSIDPHTGEVVDHGAAGGEMYVWILHRGPGGWIYGGTYPNAKLVAYDPSSDSVVDLGRMHPTEQYLRELAVAENGRVFCGIGSHADLVAYDPATGEKTSILPERYGNNSFVYPLSEGNLVYASVATDGVLLIFDAGSYEMLAEIRHPEGGAVGAYRQMANGPVIVTGLPGGEMRFNRTTRALEPCEVVPYRHYDEETGIAYVVEDQVFSAYRVTSPQGKAELVARVDVSGDGEGMDIFSLGTGPDGCIYGGSFNLLHLFRYDPATGIPDDLGVPFPGGIGEIYSLHAFEEKLYMASYTGAVLCVYDPSLPWEPGDLVDSNPRMIGPLGHEQDRPPGLTSAADGRIYVGTIPSYGKIGGALSIYDPSTDDLRVYRHVIPNQSIVSLTTSLDGWTVYGGSSLIAGGGIVPELGPVHFFSWDVRREELVLDIVVLEEAFQIQSLVTGPDGRIYGCADVTLFVFDPKRGEIVHREVSKVGIITQMVLGEDGLVYGASSSGVFRFKPMSDAGAGPYFQPLEVAGQTIALDGSGRVYFGRGRNLSVLENLPNVEPPSRDLTIYDDQIAEGWRIEATRAVVDPVSSRAVDEGACMEVAIDKACMVHLIPPDPWEIPIWEYDYLRLCINPGNSTLTRLIVSKTPGDGEAIEVDPATELSPAHWTCLKIPVEDLAWVFGSRLESLKLTATGSGTIYVDSVALGISEVLAKIMWTLLVFFLGTGRSSRTGRKQPLIARAATTAPTWWPQPLGRGPFSP